MQVRVRSVIYACYFSVPMVIILVAIPSASSLCGAESNNLPGQPSQDDEKNKKRKSTSSTAMKQPRKWIESYRSSIATTNSSENDLCINETIIEWKAEWLTEKQVTPTFAKEKLIPIDSCTTKYTKSEWKIFPFFCSHCYYYSCLNFKTRNGKIYRTFFVLVSLFVLAM